jgi:hypothetical protein
MVGASYFVPLADSERVQVVELKRDVWHLVEVLDFMANAFRCPPSLLVPFSFLL